MKSTRIKKRLLFIPSSIALAVHALAGPPSAEQTDFDYLAPAEASKSWRPNPKIWRAMQERGAEMPVKAGKTEFYIKGPLVDAYREATTTPAQPTLGKRLLAYPKAILGLVTPQPMPRPPAEKEVPAFIRITSEQGESPLAWSTVSTSPASLPRGFTDPISHEPTASWFGLRR